MTVQICADAPPLRQEASGAIRIGTSRVLLELVIGAFEDGATAEAIAQQYPSITLAETYAVIAYYLRHRAQVADYLAERERVAQSVRQRIEARQPDLAGIRARLRAARPV